MSIDQARLRYSRIHSLEPTSSLELDRIERVLGVKLPKDFRDIASFYAGGFLGGISHNSISCGGPAFNVVDETLRLRASVDLPSCYLVLAEPPESLIVLDTSVEGAGSCAVIWCDATDVSRLSGSNFLIKPDTWSTYLEFFLYLLSEEQEENEDERES